MNAVVKEEEDLINSRSYMIEPKQEVEESWELEEPKVELIDEIDVKTEEVDDNEYQHMIPYEYRDYLDQHTEEEQPTNSRKRPAAELSLFNTNSMKCLFCKKSIVANRFAKAENHAATHTSFARYSCSVEGCNFKNWHYHNVTRHLKIVHKLVSSTFKYVEHIELTKDEKGEVRKKLNECFPELTIRSPKKSSYPSKFYCQICKFSVEESNWWELTERRKHALIHTNINYECNKRECSFKSRVYFSYLLHQKATHNEIVPDTKIELRPEQKLKVEKMVLKCFPDLNEGLEGGAEKGEVDTPEEMRKPVKTMNQERSKVIKVQGNPADTKKSCNVCHKVIIEKHIASKLFRQNHALTHTGIKLYKCCNCNFKANWRFEITKHQESWHHKNCKDVPLTRIRLTKEQEMEIEEMMFRCFPEWNNE